MGSGPEMDSWQEYRWDLRKRKPRLGPWLHCESQFVTTFCDYIYYPVINIKNIDGIWFFKENPSLSHIKYPKISKSKDGIKLDRNPTFSLST